MDINQITNSIIAVAATLGLKILAAVVLYLIGRWLISIAVQLVQRGLEAQKVDHTIQRYLGNIIAVLLNLALVIAILGYFGVETTTFAALLAGVGIAIGAAWGGLLTNFAAGAFLVILRPYKVGDFITAAGVTGTVSEIGLFVTTIMTPDNVQTFVGNNKVFSDTIQNFSSTPYRRVDLTATIDHSVSHSEAIKLLKDGLSKIPNVVATPAPDVEILQLGPDGPVLCVRPYCHTDHYWQVYFDTNRLIRETFTAAGYPSERKIIIQQAN
ncbi:MAG TPA: mechanosensitive ion channel family protein [Blastocatellia bacterium]|nr:mechanosensitive ion channel family protein [Blastocatellia bacterium]